MSKTFSYNRKKEVLDNINDIIKKNENLKKNKMLPKHDKIKSASKIVFDFIKKNNRIIYGGLAINEAIKIKNKELVIYEDDDDIPDYDFLHHIQ